MTNHAANYKPGTLAHSVAVVFDDMNKSDSLALEIERDAQRYQILKEKFRQTKTSEAERIIYDLNLTGEPDEDLDVIVDRSRTT